MTAVVITHEVTIGGASVRTLQPTTEPVDLPDALAADLIRHGLAKLPQPKPSKQLA
jgi:hypothetical protein